MEAIASIGKEWKVAATKPAGGYVLVPADHLLRAWLAHREEAISLFDLRVWLACHELVARRCRMDRNLTACYRFDELRPLLGGGTLPRLRAAVRALEKAGLLAWEGDKIGFVSVAGEDEPLDAMREAVQNWRRKVPVPRRVIRLLAGCGRKVMIATVLGHLLRCVYWRDGRCISGGRCKSSWIADVFGVDYRNVKAARKELVGMGWLMPLNATQTALNRWGLPVLVNLDHEFDVGRASRKSPPLDRVSTAKSPPPIKDKELSTRVEHQKPACGRAAGVSMRQAGEPDLRNVTVADLREPLRLDVLFRQGIAAGAVADTSADRLRWFAAAERALVLGTSNPCGLFIRLISRGLWHYITNAQEDAARVKLKMLDQGGASRPERNGRGSPQITFDSLGRVVIKAAA